MSKGPWPFKPTVARRVVAFANKIGMEVVIDKDFNYRLVPKQSTETDAQSVDPGGILAADPLDQLLEKHARQTQGD